MTEMVKKPKPKKATSIDVAKAAGVSQSVVSRAFTPGGKVAPATRKKVLEVAGKMGYQPNAMARGLVTQRSNIVGIVIGDITNPFYPQVLMKFSEKLQAMGKQVLLLNVSGDQSTDTALLLALQYRVEAIIVTSVTLTSKLSKAFTESGVPIIFFNRYADLPGMVAVSCDNVGGGREVADALLRAGHRRFAYIGGKPDTSTNQDRRKGFMDRLKASGFDLIFSVEKEYSYDWGYHTARYLLGQKERPDAMFCANDIIALGVLDAARQELGTRVPEEVSVVGFDDIPAASWPAYALTTVMQPVDRMVDATLEVLVEQLSDTNANCGVKLLPGILVERASARLAALAEKI